MRKRAFSIVEVVISITIFAAFVTGASALLFNQQNLELRNSSQREIKTIIEETYEAIHSLAYDDWSSLDDGVYGLAQSGGSWSLTPTPDFIDETYRRQITIAPVIRGTDCTIDPGGPFEDDNSKFLDIDISWNPGVGTTTQTLGTQILNWKTPNDCFTQLYATQASLAYMDISLAVVNSAQKSLSNITITNNSTFTTATLDRVTLTWQTDTEVRRLMVDGSDAWNGRNGVGTPQGDQPSGVPLDIVDVIIPPNGDIELEFRFVQDVSGDTFVLTADMIDGSTSSTEPFIP